MSSTSRSVVDQVELFLECWNVSWTWRCTTTCSWWTMDEIHVHLSIWMCLHCTWWVMCSLVEPSMWSCWSIDLSWATKYSCWSIELWMCVFLMSHQYSKWFTSILILHIYLYVPSKIMMVQLAFFKCSMFSKCSNIWFFKHLLNLQDLSNLKHSDNVCWRDV